MTKTTSIPTVADAFDHDTGSAPSMVYARTQFIEACLRSEMFDVEMINERRLMIPLDNGKLKLFVFVGGRSTTWSVDLPQKYSRDAVKQVCPTLNKLNCMIRMSDEPCSWVISDSGIVSLTATIIDNDCFEKMGPVFPYMAETFAELSARGMAVLGSEMSETYAPAPEGTDAMYW